MDDELLEQALSIAGSEKDQAWYAPRCTTLTAFAPYCGTALLNPGGNGVLEPELRQIVAPVITRAQAAHGITRPDLRTGRYSDVEGLCKQLKVPTCLCSASAAMLCWSANHARLEAINLDACPDCPQLCFTSTVHRQALLCFPDVA